MSSIELTQLIMQIDRLPLDDQLELIAHLAERARQQYRTVPPRRRWSDIRGIAAHPLLGEDAQAWVLRARREDDLHREQLRDHTP